MHFDTAPHQPTTCPTNEAYLGTTPPTPPALPGGGIIGITPETGGLITAPPPVAGGVITPLSGTGRTVSPPANGFSLRGRDTPPSLPGGIVPVSLRGLTTSGTALGEVG